MNSNRYAVPENEDYEPGSDNTVLKNLLGIKNRDAIEQLYCAQPQIEVFLN